MRNPEFSAQVVARAEKELAETQHAAIEAVRKVARQLDMSTEAADCEAYSKGVGSDLQNITRYMMKSSRDTGSYEHGLSTKLRPLSKEVPIVTRKWEEKFLHEPLPTERPCVNSFNQKCFGSKLLPKSAKPMRLCEFYFPGEVLSESTELRPCLLCLREEAFKNYVQVRCSQSEIKNNVIFQRIGNIVNQRGEYCIESCFVSSTKR